MNIPSKLTHTFFARNRNGSSTIPFTWKEKRIHSQALSFLYSWMNFCYVGHELVDFLLFFKGKEKKIIKHIYFEMWTFSVIFVAPSKTPPHFLGTLEVRAAFSIFAKIRIFMRNTFKTITIRSEKQLRRQQE